MWSNIVKPDSRQQPFQNVPKTAGRLQSAKTMERGNTAYYKRGNRDRQYFRRNTNFQGQTQSLPQNRGKNCGNFPQIKIQSQSTCIHGDSSGTFSRNSSWEATISFNQLEVGDKGQVDIKQSMVIA